MKKCTFCDSELLASKESESAKCWLCGGTTFVDISEEESKRRKRQGEKKELCCPEPDCLIDLVENQRKFCVNCGRRLEKVTIDLWLRKCVDPRLKNDSRKVVLDRRVLIRDAWKMGLPKERAEKNLDEYIKGLIRPPISATQESSRQACLGSSKSLSTPRVGEVLPSQKPSHQKGALLVRECEPPAGRSDAPPSNGTAARASQIKTSPHEAQSADQRRTPTTFERDEETVPIPQRKWGGVIAAASLITLAGLAAIGWYSWSHPSSSASRASAQQSTSPDQPGSGGTAIHSADEDLKVLRQKRARATTSEKSGMIAAFADDEKAYPHDYRFPYERAKLSIKGIISDQEAYNALFVAASDAIDDAKGKKMLDDLRADKDGDFYRLSRGHNEWEVLIHALTNNDKAPLSR